MKKHFFVSSLVFASAFLLTACTGNTPVKKPVALPPTQPVAEQPVTPPTPPAEVVTPVAEQPIVPVAEPTPPTPTEEPVTPPTPPVVEQPVVPTEAIPPVTPPAESVPAAQPVTPPAEATAPAAQPAAAPAATSLAVEVLRDGSGVAVRSGDEITVDYLGTFTDGTKFDASQDYGKPFNFTLGAGQVIQGWDQGLIGMKVGSKVRMTIPPQLAYGDTPRGNIPANSTLVFEIEILNAKSIGTPEAAPATPESTPTTTQP